MIRGMDENTTSAPGQPAAPRRVPAQVAAALRLAGPREPLVDDTMFRPGPDHGPRSIIFRLSCSPHPVCARSRWSPRLWRTARV